MSFSSEDEERVAEVEENEDDDEQEVAWDDDGGSCKEEEDEDTTIVSKDELGPASFPGTARSYLHDVAPVFLEDEWSASIPSTARPARPPSHRARPVAYEEELGPASFPGTARPYAQHPLLLHHPQQPGQASSGSMHGARSPLRIGPSLPHLGLDPLILSDQDLEGLRKMGWGRRKGVPGLWLLRDAQGSPIPLTADQKALCMYGGRRMSQEEWESKKIILSNELVLSLMRGDVAKDDLMGAMLYRAHLQGANLEKANLFRAHLQLANLRSASLVEADLREADLMQAEGDGTTNLAGANLFRACLASTELGEASLALANLTEANFHKAKLQSTDFTDAILLDTNFESANLEHVVLTGALQTTTKYKPPRPPVPSARQAWRNIVVTEAAGSTVYQQGWQSSDGGEEDEGTSSEEHSAEAWERQMAEVVRNAVTGNLKVAELVLALVVQTVAGFAKLACSWEELAIDDGPKAPVEFLDVLLAFVRAGCIERSFLIRMPEGLLLAATREHAPAGAAVEGQLPDGNAELLDVTSRLQSFKRGLDAASLLDPLPQQHAAVWHLQKVASGLKKLGMPECHHEFVKRILVAALEWPRAERPRLASLLKQLQAKTCLVPEDLQWGVIRLLGQLDDLTLDNPGVTSTAAALLRTLADEGSLPLSVLRRLRLLRAGGAAGVEVLDAALGERPPDPMTAKVSEKDLEDAKLLAVVASDAPAEPSATCDRERAAEDMPPPLGADEVDGCGVAATEVGTGSEDKGEAPPAEEEAPNGDGALAAGAASGATYAGSRHTASGDGKAAGAPPASSSAAGAPGADCTGQAGAAPLASTEHDACTAHPASSSSSSSSSSSRPTDSKGRAAAAPSAGEERDMCAAEPATSSSSSTGGGKLTGGGPSLRPGGVSLRPGGAASSSLTGGAASLRPGGSAGSSLTGGVSLRPGGGAGSSLTGGVSLRPGGSTGSSLTGGAPSLRPGGSGVASGRLTGGPSGGAGSRPAAGGYPAAAGGQSAPSSAQSSGATGKDAGPSWRSDAAQFRAERDAKEKQKKGQGRRDGRKDGKDSVADSGPPPQPLTVSKDSWAAQQLRRKQEREAAAATESGPSDEEITRRMKSILNKLTLDKFDELFKQLVECGVSTEEHIRILMTEVFEKATTQHHFVEMYVLLCVNLNEWFSLNVKVGSFKHVLLDQCQSSFEANLHPQEEALPAGKAPLDEEEILERQQRHKMRVLGNIKLIGQLLVKKMVASKVLIACAEALLAEPSPATLEPLACLLSTTGGEFDKCDWKQYDALCKIFKHVQKLTKDKSLPCRARFLLQDVLDLRGTGWEDKKKATKKLEGPRKLEDFGRD